MRFWERQPPSLADKNITTPHPTNEALRFESECSFLKKLSGPKEKTSTYCIWESPMEKDRYPQRNPLVNPSVITLCPLIDTYSFQTVCLVSLL